MDEDKRVNPLRSSLSFSYSTFVLAIKRLFNNAETALKINMTLKHDLHCMCSNTQLQLDSTRVHLCAVSQCHKYFKRLKTTPHNKLTVNLHGQSRTLRTLWARNCGKELSVSLWPFLIMWWERLSAGGGNYHILIFGNFKAEIDDKCIPVSVAHLQ